MSAHAIEPSDRWWLLPLGALAVGLLLSIPFWSGDLDLRVATMVQAWNKDLGGSQQDRWWWLLPYYLPAILAIGIGLGAASAVVGGLLQPERGWLRPGLYVLLVLAVGCGGITNLLLKERWDRPRPRDTVGFGGVQTYQGPWAMGEMPGRGKSFPCGHATVPAIGFALWLLWRRRRPALARWSLAGGAVLVAWVSAARLLAQAHWLSDVLWAVVLMIVVAVALRRLVLAQGANRAEGRPRLRWPVLAGGGITAALVGAALLMTPHYMDFRMRGGRSAIGEGPWRLEVQADVAQVVIDLRAGGEHAVSLEGEVHGFGMPGVAVRRRLVCGGGVARIEVVVDGRLSEHSAVLHLVVDPTDLASIDVQVGRGDVEVRGPSEAAHVAVSAVTRTGVIRLPEGWR